MSLNKVTLIGNLGKDPEIRHTQDGRGIANFSIATSESWKDRATGERKEKTEWHNIVVFSEGLVKVIQSYVKKGSKLYIEGQLQTRKWQDKDGRDRYSTEVILQNYNGKLILLNKKDGEPKQDTPQNYDVNDYLNDFKASNNFGGKTAQDYSIEPHNDQIPF